MKPRAIAIVAIIIGVLVIVGVVLSTHPLLPRRDDKKLSSQEMRRLGADPRGVAKAQVRYREEMNVVQAQEAAIHRGEPPAQGEVKKNLSIPQTPEQVLALGQMLELTGPEGYFTPDGLEAAEALVRVRDTKLLPVLMELFKRYMEDIGSYEESLKKRGRDKGFDRRYETAKYLTIPLRQMKDERAIPVLLESLGKLEGAETLAIARYGVKVLPKLVAIVRESGDKDRKEGATRAILEMEDPQAKDELLRIFKEEKDSELRAASAQALVRLRDEKVLAQVLAKFSSESDEMVRVTMLRSLDQQNDVPFLANVLRNDRSEIVKTRAIYQMDNIGNPSAIPALEQALKDRNRNVRQLAAEALLKITGKEYEWEKEHAK